MTLIIEPMSWKMIVLVAVFIVIGLIGSLALGRTRIDADGFSMGRPLTAITWVIFWIAAIWELSGYR